MKYFAYGSNMAFEQMKIRCPGYEFLGPAKLNGYKLVFDGYSSSRSSAVANIVCDNNNKVWGGLYEISEANLAALDCYEGYPNSYQRKGDFIVMQNGQQIDNVIAYFRNNQKEGNPSKEYLNLLIRGAKDCQLPNEFVEFFLSFR